MEAVTYHSSVISNYDMVRYNVLFILKLEYTDSSMGKVLHTSQYIDYAPGRTLGKGLRMVELVMQIDRSTKTQTKCDNSLHLQNDQAVVTLNLSIFIKNHSPEW